MSRRSDLLPLRTMPPSDGNRSATVAGRPGYWWRTKRRTEKDFPGCAVGRVKKHLAHRRHGGAADVMTGPVQAFDRRLAEFLSRDKALDLVEGNDLLQVSPTDGKRVAVDDIAQSEDTKCPVG